MSATNFLEDLYFISTDINVHMLLAGLCSTLYGIVFSYIFNKSVPANAIKDYITGILIAFIFLMIAYLFHFCYYA
ncbi:hypothetical protein HNY73_009012 [Argiope bruennichi]|uniref:Uncharacterized protein n=1 Tax=Argiope bruennichi TaxID=94029 RepID=A0A8T0F949_ARGBR|nr:hypothetical protein HNY73_009012 [Argiope bruennichi]